MSETLIRFKDASLGYERAKPVLSGVTLAVAAGEFWGLVGANGAGKTTLLRCALGLLSPIKGSVTARAKDGGPARFGYVPQKETLDPLFPLSAYDVAAMGAARRFEPLAAWRDEERGRVERCLADCGASTLADRPFNALSGGQKQRVLLARALAAAPEILVLDEPLAGLDAPTRESLLELFSSLHKERGLTILMVSHRARAERKYFTHVALAENGEVLAGEARAVLGAGPEDTFRGDI